MLEGWKEKPGGQLSDHRAAETNRVQHFAMPKQPLGDDASADTKGMENEEADRACAAEPKAAAESDLHVTGKSLAGSTQQLATARPRA